MAARAELVVKDSNLLVCKSLHWWRWGRWWWWWRWWRWWRWGLAWWCYENILLLFRGRAVRPCLVITDREQSLLIEHYCPGCQLHPVPVTFIINQSYLPSYWSSQPVPGCYWSVVAANSHHPDLIRAAGAVRYGDRRTSSVPLPQLEIVTQPGGGQAELGIRTLTGSDTFLILSGDFRQFPPLHSDPHQSALALY